MAKVNFQELNAVQQLSLIHISERAGKADR